MTIATEPTTGIDPIVQLEQAAYTKDHLRTLPTLEAVLRHLDARMNEPRDGLFDDDETATAQATRVAAAMTTLLTDPGLKLTPEWYFRLIPFKRQLQALYDVSGFRASAFPLRYMSDGVARVSSPAEEQSQLLKMLLVMGLTDCSDGMLKVVERLDPTVTAPLILSLVASKVVMDPSAWSARETLLGMGSVFDKARLVPQHLPLVASAWMQCSYAIRADRHGFKSDINRWLLRSFEEAGLDLPPVNMSPPKKDRPRLVIVAEVLWDGHAMYRCYADRIRQLKDKFETILVAPESAIDDAAKALVERTVPFPKGMGQVDRMAEHIRRIEPDLVYYPSLGLAQWSVPLANLRLAPIQLMSPGHPATSGSEAMDYLLLSRNGVGEASAYVEQVVIAGDGLARQSSYTDVDVPKYRRETDDAPVKVAVPAYSMKLSWPLVEALRTVSQRARRRVQWHFFPNESGLIRQHVRMVLGRLLENTVVHPRAPYATYFGWLGQCQLAVGTFPFAGSNSNSDVLRMGLPKVVTTGRQTMERSDETSLMRFEGLESLVTDGIEAFVERTIELIDNPDERDRLSTVILEQDPRARLLDREEPGQPFLRAFEYVYANHSNDRREDRTPIDPMI